MASEEKKCRKRVLKKCAGKLTVEDMMQIIVLQKKPAAESNEANEATPTDDVAKTDAVDQETEENVD